MPWDEIIDRVYCTNISASLYTKKPFVSISSNFDQNQLPLVDNQPKLHSCLSLVDSGSHFLPLNEITSLVWVQNWLHQTSILLGLVLLNPIIWCYVWHYVMINEVVLLLSKTMVIWIFKHYHIIHKMHSMWFTHKRCKSQVLYKFRILVRSLW